MKNPFKDFVPALILLTLFVWIYKAELMAVELEKPEKNERVASVEGVPILEHELAIDEKQAIVNFKTGHGREPSAEELSRLMEETRGTRFLKKVRLIIYKKKEADWNIQVSTHEMTNKWEALTAGVDFDRAIEQQRDFYALLIAAITSVREKNMAESIVFEKTLKGKMSKQEWDGYLKYYSTPLRLKTLTNLMNQTSQDLKKPDASVRILLIEEKMNEKIDAEISASESDFAEYKKLLLQNPKDERIQKYPVHYLEIKREAWKQEQYRKAKIEVFDSKLNAIWEKAVSLK